MEGGLEEERERKRADETKRKKMDETKRKRFPRWGILDELRRNFLKKSYFN